MVLSLKKPARKLNIRRRHEALTSNDQVKKRKLKKMFTYVQNIITSQNTSNQQKIPLAKIAILITMCFLKISLHNYEKLPKLCNYRRTIDSFNEMDCWNFFETKKLDLPRLQKLLRMPNSVTFENNAVMSGEEIMLRGLYEMVTGDTQYNISSNIFGRDQSAQSRAFAWFVNHTHDTFYDLLTDNLEWWYQKEYLHKSMVAMKAKVEGNENFSTFVHS